MVDCLGVQRPDNAKMIGSARANLWKDTAELKPAFAILLKGVLGAEAIQLGSLKLGASIN